MKKTLNNKIFFLIIFGTLFFTIAQAQSPSSPDVSNNSNTIVSTLGDVNLVSAKPNVGQVNLGAANGVVIPYINNGIFTSGNLSVDRTILAQKVKIAQQGGSNWNWADYVFAKNYQLKPLEEVENFIAANKHLEGMPTSEYIAKEGLDVAPTTAKILEKVEELTLYVIQLNKIIAEQAKEIEVLKTKK